ELFPAPQSAYMHEKKLFAIESILPVVAADGLEDRDMTFLEPLYNALGYEPTMTPASHFKAGARAFYIGVVTENVAFQHRSLRRYAPDPADARPETYHLTIDKNGIFLAGVDEAGVIRGVYTLAQIIRGAKDAGLNARGVPAVPHVEIRDYPDMALRAAYLRAPATSVLIQAFAALKCNMLIFEHDDFYDLRGESLELWRRVFDETREAGMTPAPVFQALRVPDAVVRKNPRAVEGRSRIDRLTLHGDDWAAFSRRHLIATAENPIRVAVDGQPMRFRRDYLLSEGGFEPPFSNPHVHPWMIRRVPGGAIPDGATATVTYSYAPPFSNALCPHASETRVLVGQALTQLLDGLNPSYIHGGFGDITRLNQDLRCRDKSNTHAETFAAAVKLLHTIAREINSDIHVMMWADALLPPPSAQGREAGGLHEAIQRMPSDALAIARFDANLCNTGGHADTVVQWLVNMNLPVYVSVEAEPPAAAYGLLRRAQAAAVGTGMALMDANPLDPATRILLAKMWSADSQRLFWPEGLNDFFESALWSPGFSEIKDAQTRFLERRILAGEHPKALRDQFERFRDERRGALSMDAPEARLAAALFEQLTRYLELEYEFARGNERDALRGLERLLRKWGDVDAEMEQDRLERILGTVRHQKLFPPASILIGRPLAYYRPVALPAGIWAYHAPAQITFVDEKGAAQAELDFLADCGGIFRIDFETVNASKVALFSSDDGARFTPVPVAQNVAYADRRKSSGGSIGPANSAQTALEGDDARAPLFPAKPVRSRYLRVLVEAKGEQAVLRDVRAFAVKSAPRTTVPMIAGTSPDRMEWPQSPRISGFLDAAEARLAVAPTEVRLARDSGHLFIGVMAQEPMPHAMGASITARDMPLWEEESVEVRIRPGNRPARRFLVNPLGAQHDGMAVADNINQWDAGWDGEWQARAEKTSTGWTATLMIPYTTLGMAPEPGDQWHINCMRHRNNVEKETSLWAVAPDRVGLHYGTMVFE
ncbi:MAG TPA: hypothetical protein ENN29_06680, partial [Candidatus Hydrogenedentes bacterium]|nr:hypothetical protein [Candidatus Hydrogenedentota bacterium]